MPYDTRLLSYLGSGIAADRPATPNLPPDGLGFYLNTDTDILSMWDANGSAWVDWDIAGIVSAFTDLTDTPADYTGMASKLVTVKADESGVEFSDPPAVVDQEQVEDWVGGLITSGSGIVVTYDDATGSLTIATSITQYDDEMARDAIAAALAAGSGISITPNDAGDLIEIACTITQYDDSMADARIAASNIGALANVDESGATEGQSLVSDGAGNWAPGNRMVTLTQAEYDALGTPDADTYYFIVG